MATVNVNSLSNKLHYVFNLIYDFSISILAVTETWLTHSCSSSFIDLPGFNFYRGDTAGSVRKHGAGLYVSKSLSALPIEIGIQNIAVIFLPDLGLHVMSVYRPPSYEQSDNERLVQFLSFRWARSFW